MIFSIKDQDFVLHFRYVSKLGKRAQLHRGPIKAVTTAVLLSAGPRFRNPPLVAIDNALCTEGDNFSRKEGRARAFKKLLEHCGALREFMGELWTEFHRKFSGVVDCPTCKGEGWLMQAGGDGEACVACFHKDVLGGTGLRIKGYQGGVLVARHAPDFIVEGPRGTEPARYKVPASAPKTVLIMPPPPPPRRSAELSEDEVARLKEAADALGHEEIVRRRAARREKARGGTA